MSKPAETTEPTDYEVELPPHDRHDIDYGSLHLTVFVRSNGSLFIMASSGGLSSDLSVPAEHAAAFARAVSTPYSGGITS